MQQTKKGFTLIELLVVIAIIGILSAIGLVSLNGARERARDAKRKSDLSQISTALALYYDDNNSAYPAAATAGLYSAVLSSAVAPTYIGNFPAPEQTTGVNSYWYITNSASLTTAQGTYAVNKVYAMATTLEALDGLDWFIINQQGYSGTLNIAAGHALSATSMVCTATGAAGTVTACLPTPVAN